MRPCASSYVFVGFVLVRDRASACSVARYLNGSMRAKGSRRLRVKSPQSSSSIPELVPWKSSRFKILKLASDILANCIGASSRLDLRVHSNKRR